MVVDDEPDILLLLKTALLKSGYDVLTAERGLQALQMVKTEQPDLVLLDAMLPEIHGFDICRALVRDCDPPERANRPFDAGRSGVVSDELIKAGLKALSLSVTPEVRHVGEGAFSFGQGFVFVQRQVHLAEVAGALLDRDAAYGGARDVGGLAPGKFGLHLFGR